MVFRALTFSLTPGVSPFVNSTPPSSSAARSAERCSIEGTSALLDPLEHCAADTCFRREAITRPTKQLPSGQNASAGDHLAFSAFAFSFTPGSSPSVNSTPNRSRASRMRAARSAVVLWGHQRRSRPCKPRSAAENALRTVPLLCPRSGCPRGGMAHSPRQTPGRRRTDS